MMVKKHALFLTCLSMGAFMGCAVGELDLATCTRNEKNCAEGTFYFCPDGREWVSQACPNGCNDTLDGCRVKANEECAIDACDANNASIIKKCIDGHYVTQKCPSEKPICHGMTCIKSDVDCIEGNSVCDGKNMLKKCTREGKWNDIPCPNDKPVCRDGETACSAYKPCGAVAHNELTCDENKVKKCIDGDLTVTDDCTAKTPTQACDNETSSCFTPAADDCTDPVAMKDGATACMAKSNVAKLYTCTAGTATSKDCTTGIENAVAICDPTDHTKCAWKCAEGYVKTKDGKACKEDVPACTADVCDDSNASNVTFKKCLSGALADPNPCSEMVHDTNAATFGCNKAKDACVIKTCKTGFGLNTAGTACEAAPVTTCTANVCDDSNASNVTIRTCWSGELSAPDPCSTKITDTNAATFGCNTDKNACIIKTCKEGFELDTDGKACVAIRKSCKFNGKTIEDDTYFCKDATQPAICNGGEIMNLSACASGKVCNPATINIKFTCEDAATPVECGTDYVPYCPDANETQHELGNQVYECIAGKITPKDCPLGCKDDGDPKTPDECVAKGSSCPTATYDPWCNNAGNLVSCVSSVIAETTCKNGCENGACKQDGTTTTYFNINFSEKCDDTSNCTSTGTGYSTIRTYTYGEVKVVAKGNFSDSKKQMVLTANTKSPSSIKVTGLTGIGNVSFDYEKYSEKTTAPESLNIIAGSDSEVLDFSAITSANYFKSFNKPSVTTLEIVHPTQGATESNTSGRMVINNLTITK